MKHAINSLAATAASALKILLKSRGGRRAKTADPTRSIVLLGNGPSLRTTIDTQHDRLMGHSRMAVNYAALADDFYSLRPDYYIMIDGLFFPAEGASDERTDETWRRIVGADWPMTLLVPHAYADYARRRAAAGGKGLINVVPLNLTPLEGFDWFTHAAFRRGLGMPRPRNVLIAACMAAIAEGFGRIYLAGADHSWSQTLSVDEENCVCNSPQHFYKEKPDAKAIERARAAYRGSHLHDVFENLRVAFRSYFDVKSWAESRGVKIYNSTPGSMIDAFERRPIPEKIQKN